MLTYAQIVQYALQIVKAPGYTQQAGDFLNNRLDSLARRHDFDLLLKSAQISVQPGNQTYPQPADLLRTHEVWYYIGGLPQKMQQISLADYDAVNTGNLAQAYPTQYAINPASQVIHLYPMPNMALQLYLRYWSLPPAQANPATSTAVPWFPDTDYLVTALAADLMQITDDVRYPAYMAMADQKLTAFLKMQGDRENYAQRVKLGNQFGRDTAKLPPSKLTGF